MVRVFSDVFWTPCGVTGDSGIFGVISGVFWVFFVVVSVSDILEVSSSVLCLESDDGEE